MPTSHTVTTIYNMALDIVADNPVTSPADVGPLARWLNRNFVHYVEVALRQNPWNFACEYFSLNKAADAPAYRWDYYYDLPNGWLRVLPLTEFGDRGGMPIAHEVRGNRLLTSQSSPARVEIVMNVQDPGRWDPLFASMVAARLAQGMAHRFTHKASFVDRARQLAAEAYETAELVNAFEGSFEPTEQFDILRVRGL